jgi:HCOMODA/2-hydroxy-3-carboxy-muconic semialdehyde decarboxylase
MTTKKELLDDLTTANRILFNEGVVDAFGHISVRNPENNQRFFLARNMAPNNVTSDDILEHDLDGNVIGDDRKPYLERFIHSEIYRSRPDVSAVVHSHSPSVVPFSVVKSVPLRPICHMSGFIYDQSPIYEISDHSDVATDLLISDSHLGKSVASTLGHNNTVLMRGHGSTVVADSIMRAVYRAVYLEVNAKLQLQALNLGEIRYLSKEEAKEAMETVEGQMIRAWNHWKANLPN